jgi:hypothetical protein
MGEEHVAGERAQIVEEGFAGRQHGANEPVVLVSEGEEGVVERPECSGRPEGGEVL